MTPALLVLIALAHGSSDRPSFLDGNGPWGACDHVLLTEAGCCQALLDCRITPPPSACVHEHCRRFATRRGEGGAVFCSCLEVAGEAAETARRIQLLREQHRAAITDGLGRAAGNGHRVLESLYDRPIATVADVRSLTGTTYAAANTLVARLVDLRILKEMTGFARNRRFRYESYVRLFTEDATADGAASA